MTSLRQFYYLRAGVAFAWVALVVVLSRMGAPAAVAYTLLVLYPLWDALANIIDVRHSGGLRANPGQQFNAAVSMATAVALVIALIAAGTKGALFVFGVWALLSGVLQLAVGIQRRKLGGQVFMMISGAQSALAGVIMGIRAFGDPRSIAELAPYAAFGGFYFLLSALRLTFKKPVVDPYSRATH
jgi:uncharacterized membrane protein HdeD (DUF308 family)